MFSFINYSSAENAIQDTSQWDRPRTLENFASFFKHFSSDFRTSPELPKGNPRTLIVTASGLRAADISRYDPPICVLV